MDLLGTGPSFVGFSVYCIAMCTVDLVEFQPRFEVETVKFLSVIDTPLPLSVAVFLPIHAFGLLYVNQRPLPNKKRWTLKPLAQT